MSSPPTPQRRSSTHSKGGSPGVPERAPDPNIHSSSSGRQIVESRGRPGGSVHFIRPREASAAPATTDGQLPAPGAQPANTEGGSGSAIGTEPEQDNVSIPPQTGSYLSMRRLKETSGTWQWKWSG